MSNSAIKLSAPDKGGFWEIDVLLEDEHLLVLNKPPLLPAAPDRFHLEQPDLTTLLHRAIAEGKPWARERGLSYLKPAHRLDSEATGVLILAKSHAALVALAALFSAETPLRKYLALMRGRPAQAEWEIDQPLGTHALKPEMARVDREHGKRAHTRFKLLESFGKCSLVECRPLTDRRHQIRAHLRWSQTPIVGDMLYGGRQLLLSSFKRNYRLKPGQEERPLVGSTALHLEDLKLPHPVTGAELVLTAPWPKDLTVALKYLRRYAGAPGVAMDEPSDEALD